MYKKLKTGFGVSFIIVVAAGVFFQHKPMIVRMNNPHIAFISATFGQDGTTYDCDISESRIPDELDDALTSLFLNTEIRRSIFSPPQSYTVSDGSVHITIKILLDNSDSMSMFVNLCTKPGYNSAQFGDTHYYIVNHQKLYRDVYGLLSDIMSVYATKR
ncbi:MAG: hypothetical protein K2K35_08745 [Lachnospiraceae bacterium]|nr:hypothetical protein [Lachnospiraceae bacterium]